MALTKRVELLFEPEQYAQLEEIARFRRESVAALIRRAVAREYLQPTREQKLAAVQHLLSRQTDFGPWEQEKKRIGREVTREVSKGLEAS